MAASYLAIVAGQAVYYAVNPGRWSRIEPVELFAAIIAPVSVPLAIMGFPIVVVAGEASVTLDFIASCVFYAIGLWVIGGPIRGRGAHIDPP